MHISRPASLVVVSVLSLGLLAGCGGDDKASEKDAEQILEKAVEEANSDSVDIDIDDSAMTIENSDGTTVSINGGELPEGYPADEVPVIDGKVALATTSEGEGYLIAIETERSPQDALAEAVAALEGAGLAADDSMAAPDMAMLSDDTYTVMVTSADESGKTLVTYIVSVT